MSLTPPLLRALRLVADGKVERVYKSDRNAFRLIPGINANSFWALLKNGMIMDGESRGGAFSITCTMILTEKGRQALVEYVEPV